MGNCDTPTWLLEIRLYWRECLARPDPADAPVAAPLPHPAPRDAPPPPEPLPNPAA